MKKRICVLFFILALLASLCLTASASQIQPVANEDFAALFAVSATDMESESLVAGVGDPITLHLYVNVNETESSSFSLLYDADLFTLRNLAMGDTEGQCTLTCTSVSDGAVLFNYEHKADGAYHGLFLMATVTFENKAAETDTVYSFSLNNGATQICNPVSVQVNHRHAFGNWETVFVSEDKKTQRQKRECLHCDMYEEQIVPFVDYTITLKPDAQEVRYQADKKLLYAIAPGATVGELIDSLSSVGNMQVVDKNGNGKSRNDVLATGMKLLVMDEGDGMDANVQFTADISVWGDGDCDGNVSAGDARLALRKSVSLETGLTDAQLFALDSDNSGYINAGDARFLLRVSVNLDAFYAVDAVSVMLTPSELVMNVGEQKSMIALLFPTETTIRTITWRSSNTAVATVSNGVVTATGKGTAVITATAHSGVSASATVTVSQAVKSITCKRVNFYLPETKTLDLNEIVEINPSAVTLSDATWKSDNTAFTVVGGVVRCMKSYDELATKTAKLTCTFPCGTAVTFNVTLIPTGSTFCRFNYETVQVNEGQQFKLSGSISTGSTLKIVSDNTDVLTVSSDNIITAKAAGTATLTCSGVDYSEKVTVTVMSKSLRVVSVAVNSGGNDLTIAVKNTDTQDLTKINMTVAGYDSSGKLLVTKGCSVSNVAAGKQNGYVWKDLWGDAAVASAKITQITLTYADGHMATIPAGCWLTGE